MPRIYNSGNDALDFCRGCYPKTEEQAERIFGDISKTGEGPDDRGNCFGYDTEHPDYEHENYRCTVCRVHLTYADN